MKRTLLALVLATACHRSAEPTSAVVEARPEDGLDLALARVTGPVRAAHVEGNRLVLDLRRPGDVTVRLPGACPLTLQVPAGGATRADLVPWLRFSGENAEAGFDAELALVATPGCTEARGTRVEWEPTGAPWSDGSLPLRDVRVSEDHLRFSARTASMKSLVGDTVPWGIVPVSARARGEAEIRARYRTPDGDVTRVLHTAAAARATGLPSIPVGTRVYLSPAPFRVLEAPEGAHAQIEDQLGVKSFRPDRSGSWELGDGTGRLLRLVSRRYDDTPLDCTRADCHRDLDSSSRGNPMTSVLQRGLDNHFGALFPGAKRTGSEEHEYPRCAGGCHVAGEPGIDDGGFYAVARALGWNQTALARSDWHGAPASLRRLGGVGCLACHGPGAIPEASARYGILRADVCATCHDAPPVYDHVAAWRTSRMARSDADPRVSDDPTCARCHTTWGFLEAPARRPPKEIGTVGISCAACHSVHPRTEGAMAAGRCEEALTRRRDVPPLLAGSLPPSGERSQVCLSCHAAAPDEGSPMASAALLWLGRGGVNPRTGEPLNGLAPEAGAPLGCVGCHDDGRSARGAGHGFHATRKDPADPSLAKRARALLSKLVPGAEGVPLHASKPKLDRTTPEGRAAWNVALVLEDPAADAHNPEYAKTLLDTAAALLEGGEAR